MFTASLGAGRRLAGPAQRPPGKSDEKPPLRDEPAAPAAKLVGHMVYFTLKEPTAEGRAKLVASCDKYLEGLDGILFYAAGPRGEQFKGPVNDTAWDVALHVVFKDKAAYDAYEVHADHVKFVNENKAAWEKVRVFDSELAPRKKK